MVKWFEEVQKKAAELIVVVEKLDGIVDKETIEFRKKECEKCLHNIDKKCNLCGCFIELKVVTKKNRTLKGTTEVTHCPLGKWNDKDLAIIYSLIN